MLGVISIVTSVSKWPTICNALSMVGKHIQKPRMEKLTGAANYIGNKIPGETKQIYSHRDFVSVYFETRLLTVDQHLLKKWKPEINLIGVDHLENSLNENKGVILLVTPFAYSNLIAKMALFQHGYKVSHLSHPSHGYSETKFGRKYLNKIKTRIEDRYLEERVKLDINKYAGAMRYLRRLLQDKKVISITVGSDTARPIVLSVFGREIKISMGPFRLAAITNAPILPVFVLKKSILDYTVFIEPAINNGIENAKNTDLSATLDCYGKLFEKYVAKDPGQLRGELFPND